MAARDVQAYARKTKLAPGPPIAFTSGNNQKTKSLNNASVPGYAKGAVRDFLVPIVDIEAPLLIGMAFLQHPRVTVDFEL